MADTALADLVWLPQAPAPQRILVAPDSLRLGSVMTVAVDVPADQPSWPDSLLSDSVPWLAPATRAGHRLPLQVQEAAGGQEQPAGWPDIQPGTVRLVRDYRVYRLDPFQLRVGGLGSEVISVGRRATDKDTVAPVRDPRALGWRPAAWVVWLGSILLLGLLLWVLWRRRKRLVAEMPHRSLPRPAWLDAACRLEALLRSDLLARGEGRLFLDQLAGIIRSFLADRYLIGAREMTADEIIASCGERAYVLEPVRTLATLMGYADHWRYHPAVPDLTDCRTAAAQFFQEMAALRIMPEFTPVAAAQSLQAGRAWAYLRQELEVTPVSGDRPERKEEA